MGKDLFQNKYRIPSARLQNWDYRWNAPYFITICTRDRVHYFGEVVDANMVLSPIGVLADLFLFDLKQHHKNAVVDVYQVMPNHVHLILVLDDGGIARDDGANRRDDGANRRDVACNVCTASPDPASPDPASPDSSSPDSSSPDPASPDPASPDPGSPDPALPDLSSPNAASKKMAAISPKAGSVSVIMRSYKSAVSRHAHRLGFDFDWHPRFHDSIIRDANAYQRIYKYIQNNPENWENDKYNVR